MRHDDDKGKEQNRDQNNNCVRHVVDKNSAFRARYEVSLANFITNVYYTPYLSTLQKTRQRQGSFTL